MIQYTRGEHGEAKESQPLKLNGCLKRGTENKMIKKDIRVRRSNDFVQSPTHIISFFYSTTLKWPLRYSILASKKAISASIRHRYRPYLPSHSNFFHRSPADEKRDKRKSTIHSNLITLARRKQKHKQTSKRSTISILIKEQQQQILKMAEVLPIQNVVDAATAKIHSASGIINPAAGTTTTTNTNATLANPLPSTNTSNRLGRSAKQTGNSNAKATQPVRKVR